LFVPEDTSAPEKNGNILFTSRVFAPDPAKGEEIESSICNININGFGFIKEEDYNNIFFHYSTVANKDFTDLQPGMRVKYSREEDAERSKKDGTLRYRACKVSVIE
jgi:cold shock CspA family protein